MSSKRFIAGVVLLVLLVVAFGERRTLLQARSRHEVLVGQITERCAGLPNNTAAKLGAEPVNADAQDAIRDLPRLRNQVRVLREQSRALPKLQAENDSLQTRLTQVNAAPPIAEPTPENGFLMKEAWVYAGFNSPEATVQSFFCALRDGNVANVMACLASGSEGGPSRDNVMEGARGIARIKGYRIVGSEFTGADKAVVKLQAAVNGMTIDMPVLRKGLEWKIDFDR